MNTILSKKIFAYSTLTILTLAGVGVGQTAVAEAVPQERYVWVLVHEMDDRGVDDLEEIDAKLKKYEKSGIESTLNNTGYYVDYSVQKTFAGMNSSAQATISTTPLEIEPDTEIPLNLRVSVTENEGYDGRVGDASASARVVFCGNNSTPQEYLPPTLNGKPFYDNEFKSESGESIFSSNEVTGFANYDTTISASLPAGTVHGEAIAVCAEVTLIGVKMGTVYHYRWMPSGSGTVSGINKKYDVPKDENGDYIDSGVRVSDISGEVYVRRGDASAVEWELLNFDDVIYEGDMIHTKDRNSRCTLSLTDLTTFDLRPRTGIIINTRSEKESALSILAGKVLVNVKKMIKDGSMNVEMSQCIAGARGTIFVLQGDDVTSNVRVLEGNVEIQSTNGESILLSAGEEVSAQDGALQAKETFELTDELNSWEETTRKKIVSDIAERTGKEPNLAGEVDTTQPEATTPPEQSGDTEKPSFTYVYVVLGFLVLAGVAFWYRKK